MSLLHIDHISLSFGKKKVLNDISLEIAPNTIVGLIGPSGCGKSTLLRCINRMHDDSPDARVSGTVHFDGTDIYGPGVDVHTVRSKIGMVFQKPNPFPKSIRENIAFGLRVNGIRDKKRIDETVERSLKEAFLWEEVHDKLHESALALSGGQQQRLCIARCIAVRPEVILMDEPTSALDPIATQKIEALITHLKSHYTIVIVTHNMQQAHRIADKIAMLYLGDLIEYRETKAFFENPGHDLAKQYITGEFG